MENDVTRIDIGHIYVIYLGYYYGRVNPLRGYEARRVKATHTKGSPPELTVTGETTPRFGPPTC